MTIPDWTASGVLPPVDPLTPVSGPRSPYRSTLDDVILRFGTSKPRRIILAGWLGYRESLHAAGIISGFQWIDGSFLEDIEMTAGRPPSDIDCVTFFHIPSEKSEQELVQNFPGLFFKEQVKEKFKVDGYTTSLALPPHLLVSQSCYWYSVWSHRRDFNWKGFVEVDLEPSSDARALMLLSSLTEEEGSK